MDTSEFRFAHYKLHAWQVAHELANRVDAVVERLPAKRRDIADQVLRAATGTEALIAEGAPLHQANEAPAFHRGPR
jgi:four helix bundle protein